ncbi:hypothetical protein BDQ17DRAFT_1365666 [Cyathus striatus]|nr:hypothetical protein BDQ17DRAFT_1365666 [Cyathus striatus]
MPFRVPSQSDLTISPSVSLERGGYRMRAPPSRLSDEASRLFTQEKPESRPRKSSSGNLNVNAAAVMIFLATGCILSFGTAYFLYVRGNTLL